MSQPHQHGPNCKHGTGGHGGHNHGGHGHQGHGHGHGQGGPQMSTQQYMEKLRQMKKENKQFYCMQILQGNALPKYLQSKGLDFLAGINAQMIIMLVAQASMMFTCEWMPLFLRPFISGMFAPLVLLLFFNSNVVYGFDGSNLANIGNQLMIIMFITCMFFIFTALRQSGYVNTPQNKHKTLVAHRQKVYLENPSANCEQCHVLKAFRAFHCPVCKVCVSKFTRHSLAFGICIGSTNQIFAWLFFTFLTVTQALTLNEFFWYTSYGLITQIFFYLLNAYILWISLLESVTLAVFNFYYGITENQIRQWMQSKYLMKIPQGQFENTLNRGLAHNIKESLYAMLSIKGVQSQNSQPKRNPMAEQIPSSESDYEQYDKNIEYTVNWAKAFYYITPQIPYHPYRQRIIEIMARQQPRMVQMYKLQKQFKQEVKKQTQGEQLSEFQMQQRVSMKMQQHMMKNNPQMMMMGRGPQQQPSTQQQKSMQIQMLTHMKQQMTANDPDIATKIGNILDQLKQDEISTVEVNSAMKDIQSEIMKKRMESILKQRQQTQQAKQQKKVAEVPTKDKPEDNQDEEEKLNKLEQIPDEDL